MKNDVDRTETNLAVLCHIGGLMGLLFFPGNVIVPLVIWLWKKEEYPSLDKHAVEVINFHITLTIYMIISALLVLVLIGFPMFIALLVFAIVVGIKGARMAGDGYLYNYPMALPFIK
ncbi:MAG: DUF4870 domain-containing protein [Acidobacteriota bacterium]|nr:DUF4870 domain-containing protein [Acidobacteriota bacterium]